MTCVIYKERCQKVAFGCIQLMQVHKLENVAVLSISLGPSSSTCTCTVKDIYYYTH